MVVNYQLASLVIQLLTGEFEGFPRSRYCKRSICYPHAYVLCWAVEPDLVSLIAVIFGASSDGLIGSARPGQTLGMMVIADHVIIGVYIARFYFRALPYTNVLRYAALCRPTRGTGPAVPGSLGCRKAESGLRFCLPPGLQCRVNWHAKVNGAPRMTAAGYAANLDASVPMWSNGHGSHCLENTVRFAVSAVSVGLMAPCSAGLWQC